MTDKKNNIYQQLRDAQLELKAPKTEEGRFGKSRSAEMILESAKPVLVKHGLTLTNTDEIVLIGDRHYVKATSTVYDDKGESIQSSAYAWEGGQDRGLDAAQVTGKASSYARKYAMSGLLAIDDTKDADNKDHPPVQQSAPRPAVGSAPVKAPDPNAVSRPQVVKLQALFQELGLGGTNNRDDRLAYAMEATGHQLDSLNDLTKLSANQLIEKLQADVESLSDQDIEQEMDKALAAL